MTVDSAISFASIDMLRPQTNSAVITIDSTHIAINNYPQSTMRAFESPCPMFPFPFLFLFLFITKISIMMLHAKPCFTKNQLHGWLLDSVKLF